MKRTIIEPELLSVFRMFTALQLGFWLFRLLLSFVFDRHLELLTSYGIMLEFAYLLFLMGYLSSSWVMRHMGRFFLPLALLVASLTPIIVLRLILDFDLPESSRVLGAWQMIPIVFLPLILVAWQYNFKAVVLFSIGTALFHLALTPPSLGEEFSVLSVIVLRTFSFILVGYIVVRVLTTQREQRKALSDANKKLTHYATTLEQLAISRERNRLARELHDTLAHTLSGLAVQLEAVSALWEIEPAEARMMLDRSAHSTREGLAETRRALRDLRASPLADLGLSLAIRELAESMAARASLQLEMDIPEWLGKLTPAVEQCIYRVAQEAIANVGHHAEASYINVSLNKTDEWVILTIEDNGRGFHWNEVDRAQHFGLKGLQERAEMVGGLLEVDSIVQQGTTVCLRIEVKDDSRLNLR